MRIIVTGGRNYTDRNTIAQALHDATTKVRPFERVTLVHGDAPGADRLAASVAARTGWTTEPHPADWGTHGRAAGPIRNQAMADAGGDLLIAFPGGRGTANMIRCAEAAGIPVRRVV